MKYTLFNCILRNNDFQCRNFSLSVTENDTKNIMITLRPVSAKKSASIYSSTKNKSRLKNRVQHSVFIGLLKIKLKISIQFISSIQIKTDKNPNSSFSIWIFICLSIQTTSTRQPQTPYIESIRGNIKVLVSSIHL